MAILEDSDQTARSRTLVLDVVGGIATLSALIAPLGWLSAVLAVAAASIFVFASRIASALSLDQRAPGHLRWFSGIAGGAALLTLVLSMLGGEEKSAVGYLAGISNQLQRSNETLTDIKGEVEQAKREKSDDPRKELANLGVPWSREAFQESVRNADVRTVELFLDGDMQVDPYLLQYFVIDATPNDWGSSDYASDRFRYSKDVASVIAEKGRLAEDACSFEVGGTVAYLGDALNQPGRADFLQQACRTPKQKEDLQAAIAKARS